MGGQFFVFFFFDQQSLATCFFSGILFESINVIKLIFPDHIHITFRIYTKFSVVARFGWWSGERQSHGVNIIYMCSSAQT